MTQDAKRWHTASWHPLAWVETGLKVGAHVAALAAGPLPYLAGRV